MPNRELATSNTAGEIHYVLDECGGTIDGFGIELGPCIDVGVVCSGEVSEIQAFSDSHTLTEPDPEAALGAVFGAYLSSPLIHLLTILISQTSSDL